MKLTDEEQKKYNKLNDILRSGGRIPVEDFKWLMLKKKNFRILERKSGYRYGVKIITCGYREGHGPT